MATTSCPRARCSSSETTALPKWPLAPLTPIFMPTSNTSLTNRLLIEVCSRPCGKLRRLSAGNFVGERDCVTRIRAEIRVGLEVGEHRRDFLGAWEQAGKKFLRDLLERELVPLP